MHLQLEGALHKLDAVHESFRLWITAEPHPAFPIGLLQMGIKVTNEAPVGMKAGLRASYQWITQVGFLPLVASLLKVLDAWKSMCNVLTLVSISPLWTCIHKLVKMLLSNVLYSLILTDNLMQDMLDAVNRSEWRQLLFLETFLHSVVQERRKFGPIGWNVPYEFNLSDLSACVQFLQVLNCPSNTLPT